MSNTIKLGGWKKDEHDARDRIFTGAKHVLAEAKVGLVDLRQWCSPVEDQRQMGSCVANGIVGALEMLRIRAGYPHIDLSRLFVYYNARLSHGAQNLDEGTYVRNAVASLTNQGTCTEEHWRYTSSAVFTRPDWNCYREAYANRISGYESVRGKGNELLDGIEGSLAGGFAVVFGMQVDKNFMENVDGSGKVPPVSDQFIGGHATLIVGINRNKGHIIGRNSWGTQWGDDGYYYLPFGQLVEREAYDFWSIQQTTDFFNK